MGSRPLSDLISSPYPPYFGIFFAKFWRPSRIVLELELKGGILKLILFYPLLLIIGCGEKAAPDKPFDAPVEKPENNNNSNVESNKEFEIKQENFVSGVNNPYFTLTPGRKFYYDGASPEGIKIHKEILATDHKREIAGVETLATWTREWHDNSLVSDSKNWYAQDKEGNVWWFGENKQDIFGGTIKSKSSEWLAGVNNAKAGIIVPGAPKSGDPIAVAFNGIDQEKAEVLAVGESVQVPRGQLKDCLKIGDYSAGDSPSDTQQYYCKETGNLSVELIPDTFGKLELTKIEDNYSTSDMDIKYPELKFNLSEEQAKEIALGKVLNSDSVTAINLVVRNDDPVYAIDVIDTEKDTTRVYLDVLSGRYLTSEKVKN